MPVFLDPSHIAGRSDLVPEIARKASGLNYFGLFIEVHPQPSEALSDASQQLTPVQFDDLLHTLESRVDAPSTESLEILRRDIDSIDDCLLELLARRMAVSRQIGDYKRRNRIPILQADRYKALIERRAADAERLDLSPAFVSSILAAIHEESVRQQM